MNTRGQCAGLCLAIFWLAAVGGFGAPAGTNSPGVLEANPEPGWPQWRGPRRDGVCTETGLLQTWPEGGPRLLWKAPGLGAGYCAPIIADNRIYLAGDQADELRLFALDLQGRPLWTATNGRAWKGPYPGARASCAYRDGRLFHMNAHGRVACLDAATGKELWALSLLDRFGGKVNTWAYSECLLVDGSRAIVTPGGPQALMAALDVRNGETVWRTAPLRPDDDPGGAPEPASYASPILFTLGARRQLVNCSLRHVFGVDADTGKLLWSRPLRTRYSVIAATPVLVGDAVFVTAPDTDDAKLYRLHETGSGVDVEELWSTRLDTCHGGVVSWNGALYGAWYRNRGGYGCVDARTGAVRFSSTDLAKGSILYADARLYCLTEEGEMALLKPGASGFEFAGRFRLAPRGKSDVWSHAVILDRKLYLRFQETLFCYDIKAP